MRPLDRIIYIEPIPKGRPRVGRYGNVFTPQRTVSFENCFRASVMEDFPAPLHGDIGLTLRIYRKHNRGDLDNYIKAISDALNGLAWIDDKQIKHIDAYMFTDKEHPRIEYHIAEL